VTRRWNDRLALLNWRSSLVTVALVGMVLISALGAWQVRESWLQHRRAVERTLDAYAAYAARAFSAAAANEVYIARQLSMAPVLGAPAYPDDPLTLERFAEPARKVLIERTGMVSDPMRGFYRVDVRTGGYTAMGKAAEPKVASEIRDLVRAQRAILDTTKQAYNWVLQAGDGGSRVSTSMAPRRDAEGRVVAIYGFTVSWQESFAPLMQRALPRMMLLPPSLPGAGVASAPLEGLDTLVSLRIVTTDGFVYYETPQTFTSTASGTFVPPGSPMRFQATLHPDLVARLRREMLDDDRRQLQLALPILSVLFAITAILHVRRERELVRARRDFVASVSHELRTPLAQIRMFSETLLLRREDNEEERLKWLGIIGREARRLGDLVENILLFSHIDAARVRLEPERTDLGELVEEVVEAYVPIAEARRMRIVADAPSRIFAVVDPRALRQVVVNLIDNALKYGPAGQTVTVEVDRNDGEALLTVADQGPGIPPRDRSRLWRPFVRLGNGGSTAGGSGIGLSVVRSLVEQHGGTVAVGDAEGAGARFTVTLPV
jgi:signal transduction histidine kinase